MTDQTLVVKSDDNQFHLFTHGAGIVSQGAVTPGARVRVTGSAPDAVGTRVAEKADLVQLIEGTVVSASPETLVVKTDDNNFRMFTYSPGTVPQEGVKPDARVRVNAVAPNAQAARVADSVTVIQPGQANVAGTETHVAAAQPAQPTQPTQPTQPAQPTQPTPAAAEAPSTATHAAPSALPEAPSATMQASGGGTVNQTSKKIEAEARKFHAGGRLGFGLDPELFMFGVQVQFGPFFDRRFMFQPNLEFGFGEITDMYAVNGDAAFHFSESHSGWVPYLGGGPSFNFVNRSAGNGTTHFGDFHYSTGLDLFAGAQRKKMFVEMKTVIWATNAPILRMYAGYNF